MASILMKKLTTEKIIKVLNSTILSDEYFGKSFVVDPLNELLFIDWLNGGRKALSDVVHEVIEENAYSIAQGNHANTHDLKSYVSNLIVMRVFTQRGELNFRSNPEAVNYGAETWFKRTKGEVDILITNLLYNTKGVLDIYSYNSEVDKQTSVYKSNFALILDERGETLWQSIEI